MTTLQLSKREFVGGGPADGDKRRASEAAWFRLTLEDAAPVHEYLQTSDNLMMYAGVVPTYPAERVQLLRPGIER